MLANLVGNALDAMPHGGTLRLRVRGCTDWKSSTGGAKIPAVRITVADTGHGMTPATMKRLYEPFFTTKESFGTGLGLWVSAGIVEKHRGHFHVRSSTKPGKSGTVFTLIFPLDGGLPTT